MGKTRRKVDKRAEEVASSSVSHDEIIENRRREMGIHLATFQDQMKRLIDSLYCDMRTTVSSLPPEIAQMKVEDFIKQYMENVEKEKKDDQQPLQEVQNISAPTQPAPKTQKRAPRRREKVQRMPHSSTTQMTRSRKCLETPSVSRNPLILVEGTPIVIQKPTSQFQLSEKPRCMEKSDEISALGLTAYSVRGSPMTLGAIDDEVLSKLQETLQPLMQHFNNN